MIDGLISRVRNTPVQTKDTEAEQHIQQALAGVPDSQYVLVQTVLVQQYGLEQAQAQLNELKQQNQLLAQRLEEAQQQQQKSSGGGSFLSHLFGSSNEGAVAAAAPQPVPFQPVNNPGAPAGSYAGGNPPPPAYPSGGYPAQPYPSQGYPARGGMFGGGGGGGFLQGALQTAAGVAAGEMMFQGMEDLFHGFGRGGSERGFTGGGGGETVVSNFYDDDRGRDQGNRDDSSFYNPGDDASRQDFSDAGANQANFGGFDDNNANDFGSANAGSDNFAFDNGDSGGFDDNPGGDDFSDSGDMS